MRKCVERAQVVLLYACGWARKGLGTRYIGGREKNGLRLTLSPVNKGNMMMERGSMEMMENRRRRENRSKSFAVG